MPKIKLIKVHDAGKSCDYCEHYVKDYFLEQMSDWQEITEEELKWLQSWQGRNYTNKQNVAVVILQDITDKKTVAGFVDDIKKFVEQEEIRKKEQEQKYKEAEKKRKLAAEQRKIDKAKKLLEKSGIKINESK